tara:strand:- start:188 stop:388 length:201 start_codon:yes stop_codon:yes gene_type:complete
MSLAQYHGDKCLSQLAILLDEVGKLDDYFETDLIDNRTDPGAYQYISYAIARIEEYMYIVGKAYGN